MTWGDSHWGAVLQQSNSKHKKAHFNHKVGKKGHQIGHYFPRHLNPYVQNTKNQPSKNGFHLTLYMHVCPTVPILGTAPVHAKKIAWERDKQRDRQTWPLLDQIGPVGRFSENHHLHWFMTFSSKFHYTNFFITKCSLSPKINYFFYDSIM